MKVHFQVYPCVLSSEFHGRSNCLKDPDFHLSSDRGSNYSPQKYLERLQYNNMYGTQPDQLNLIFCSTIVIL